MAQLVGPSGRVYAMDVQERMLAVVEYRARKAGLSGRVSRVLVDADAPWDVTGVDFAVASWMVHEVPDLTAFFGRIAGALKPGGRFLLIEPRMHVSRTRFESEVDLAESAGLDLDSYPRAILSRAALFLSQAG